MRSYTQKARENFEEGKIRRKEMMEKMIGALR